MPIITPDKLDRCPCGTGTSDAMAALYAQGDLPLGVEYVNEGIIGTRFRGKLLREVRLGDLVAVEPVITGTAYLTGIQQFMAVPIWFSGRLPTMRHFNPTQAQSHVKVHTDYRCELRDRSQHRARTCKWRFVSGVALP